MFLHVLLKLYPLTFNFPSAYYWCFVFWRAIAQTGLNFPNAGINNVNSYDSNLLMVSKYLEF